MLRLVGLLVPRIVGFRLKHQHSTRVNLCSGSWRREAVVLHENEAITGHGGPHMHELRMSCTRDPRSRSRRLGSESWKDLPPRLLHLLLCISQNWLRISILNEHGYTKQLDSGAGKPSLSLLVGVSLRPDLTLEVVDPGSDPSVCPSDQEMVYYRPFKGSHLCPAAWPGTGTQHMTQAHSMQC